MPFKYLFNDAMIAYADALKDKDGILTIDGTGKNGELHLHSGGQGHILKSILMGIFYLAISYLFGYILAADIVTKLKHNPDIGAEGSGKPSARNMLRVYGKGYLLHLYKIKTTYLYVVFIRLWRKSSPQPVFVSEPLFMCQH